MKGWIDDARNVALADVLQHLGVQWIRGRTVGPCPACGAPKRGSTDKRGPVDVNERDGRHFWHCKRCEVGGDALDAVALVIGGGRLTALSGEDKRRVAEWFSDRGWCTAPRDHVRPETMPAPQVQRMPDDAVEGRREYPPQDEVLRLWECCTAVAPRAGDEWPAMYLRDRGLDAALLSGRLGVVKATPSRLRTWPAWWPGDRWGMYRLMVLAYDANGAPRSVHARRVLKYRTFEFQGEAFDAAVCESCGDELERHRLPSRIVERCHCGWMPKPKTLWPVGVSSERLLFADGGGVRLLRGAGAPPRVLVVEGLTDTLRAATVAPSAPCAVLGFTSGGAKALGDVRWPRGAEVGIATDDDSAGEKYADEVADAIRPLGLRARRIRWAALLPAKEAG